MYASSRSALTPLSFRHLYNNKDSVFYQLPRGVNLHIELKCTCIHACTCHVYVCQTHICNFYATYSADVWWYPVTLMPSSIAASVSGARYAPLACSVRAGDALRAWWVDRTCSLWGAQNRGALNVSAIARMKHNPNTTKFGPA